MNNTKAVQKKPYFRWLSMSPVAGALWLALLHRAEAAEAKKFEPAQMRADYQIARPALEEAHPGLYRYAKKSDLDCVFDSAEKALDHPMDFFEFYRLMAIPIAAIKCGHTDVSLSPEARKEAESMPGLPFDVRVMDSRAFIFRDYAQAGALAGREIQSINGVAIGQIISTMLSAESQDGDVQTSRQGSIGGNFALNLIILLGLRAPYEVVLAGCGTGPAQAVHLAGLTHQERSTLSSKMYPQDHPKKDFASLKWLDDGHIALLTYSSFGTAVDEGQAFMKRA
ncbi:MAG TPA: hypothetical protein VFE51_20355 [Verrucomicrobiae bacterium]|nr:hypothetical protein [Verrucomicrobiae bacterium]